MNNVLFNLPFIATILTLIAVVIIIIKGIRIVQQAEVLLIERLGKYYKTLSSGVNIIIPLIDNPRKILWQFRQVTPDGFEKIILQEVERIDLREQIYDFAKQNVITKDNVTIEIDALLYFQITDPVKAVYEINNLPNAIEKLAQTTLRNIIGELDLDESLVSRDTINAKLREVLDDATDKWGVKVNRVELKDITPPLEIQNAMEKQMKAERARRAKILEAEGLKQAFILESEGIKESEINKATGEKQATILEAEGNAESIIKKSVAERQAIENIAAALGPSKTPENYLIAMKYLETLHEITSGKDNKIIYMPYEATSVLSSLGGIKEMLGIEKNAPVDK